MVSNRIVLFDNTTTLLYIVNEDLESLLISIG